MGVSAVEGRPACWRSSPWARSASASTGRTAMSPSGPTCWRCFGKPFLRHGSAWITAASKSIRTGAERSSLSSAEVGTRLRDSGRGHRRGRHSLDRPASGHTEGRCAVLRLVCLSLPGSRRESARDGLAPGADPVARSRPPLRALPDLRWALDQHCRDRAGRRMAYRVVDGRRRDFGPGRGIRRVGRSRAPADRFGKCHQTLGMYDRDPLERWTAGRVSLLGDAAHAMLPFFAQGAAQAIEDAVVLARCLASADAESAPGALQSYERLRRPRTGKELTMRRGRAVRNHLPDGPEQRKRDADFASGDPLRDSAWLYGYNLEDELSASSASSFGSSGP